MKRIVTTELISSLLILLFCYTALSKLFSVARFEAVLEQLPLISSGAALLAWQVPLTELCIVLLLFFPVTRLAGLYGSLLLLCFFTIYLVYMVLFSQHLPCSCGGVISSMSWPVHIGFNGFCIGANMVAIRNPEWLKRVGDECIEYKRTIKLLRIPVLLWPRRAGRLKRPGTCK